MCLSTYCRISALLSPLAVDKPVNHLGELYQSNCLPRFFWKRPILGQDFTAIHEQEITLEQCAVREVHEEVGISITNLRYFLSQPWPFPDSLTVAFFADYAGGENTPAPVEIEAADWFRIDALPPLHDHASISRHLIDAACREATLPPTDTA